MELKKLSLGGVTIALDLGAITVSDWPHPFYTPFISQKPPDFHLSLERVNALPPVLSQKPLFEGAEGKFREWIIFEEGEGYRIELFDNRTQERDRSVQLSGDFTRAKIFALHSSYLLSTILRPLLEIMFVHYLAPRGGLLLHAASIRDGDQGYLFAGPSENGKTTTARFWYGKEGDISVLNDERSFLRKTEEGWRVYGSPWPGDGYMISSESAPLAGVFLVRHGKKHEAIQPPPVILFQEIFAQVFSSFWHAPTLEHLSANCEELIRDVPCFQLPFLKEASVTDFIRKVIHDTHRVGVGS